MKSILLGLLCLTLSNMALANAGDSPRSAKAICKSENEFNSKRCQKKASRIKSSSETTLYSDCLGPRTYRVTSYQAGNEGSLGEHQGCQIEAKSQKDSEKRIQNSYTFGQKNTEQVVKTFTNKEGENVEEITVKTADGMLYCTRKAEANAGTKKKDQYSWCGLSNSANRFTYTKVQYPGRANVRRMIRGSITATDFFNAHGNLSGEDKKLASGDAK